MVTIDVHSHTTRDGRLLSAVDPPTYQLAWEWEQLLRLFDMRVPRRVLEVGSDFGGTLRGWIMHAPAGSIIVNVDDRCVDAETWQGWARERGSTLHTIQGDSRSHDTIALVERHTPYDWIFIDADHSYDNVASDWRSYGPLVRSGGIVAFHDINERNDYGVSQLWREIQAQGYVTQEINAQIPSLCGVGVVYMP